MDEKIKEIEELKKLNNERLNLIDEWKHKWEEINGFLQKAESRIKELEKELTYSRISDEDLQKLNEEEK